MYLLHGFACQPRMWDFIGDGHAIRLPGHGPSPAVLDTERFMDVVDHLAAFVEGDVVGYSMGARIALALALAHPKQIRSLLLIGVHAGLDDPYEKQARRQADEQHAQTILHDGVAAFMDRWQAQPLFATQAALPEPRRDAIRRDRLAHTAEGLAWAMRVLGLGNMPSLRPLLSPSLPITLLCGARDRKFCDEAARIARVSNAAVEVVADVGHNVVAEAPDAVLETIRRWRSRA